MEKLYFNIFCRTILALQNGARIMEIGPGKRFCATFFARYYFYARADNMQKRGYWGAHGHLRVIKFERIDS